MKAIVTTVFGDPPSMEIQDRVAPEAVTGHTLVRMHAATINQLSNSIRTGQAGAPPNLSVLGNEGTGEVVESGSFEVGARVLIYGGADLGVTEDGLFQELVSVRDDRIARLPHALTWEEGAAFAVNYLTAYLALTKVAEVQRGDYVLVSGASGSVGHALLETVQALGANPIGVVSSSEKAQRVRSDGIEHVVDLSKQNLQDVVRELTGGEGAHSALDPVGGELFASLALEVRPRGRVVSIGFAGGTESPVSLVDMVTGEKHLLGYSLHAEDDVTTSHALAEILAMADRGLLCPVIDSTYNMVDVEQGYQRLTSRRAIGSVIVYLQADRAI